jgi:hypothetical protein
MTGSGHVCGLVNEEGQGMGRRATLPPLPYTPSWCVQGQLHLSYTYIQARRTATAFLHPHVVIRTAEADTFLKNVEN